MIECRGWRKKPNVWVLENIQFNSIKFISTFIHHYMSIIIIIHCIFLNEKSKWICRKLNKLIRDIPGKHQARMDTGIEGGTCKQDTLDMW